MATLYEYFVKDGAQNLTQRETWPIANEKGETLGEVVARLHLDFDARAKYISFFVQDIPGVMCPEALALNQVAKILDWTATKVQVQAGQGGECTDASDLIFTGQIYIYSERPVPPELENRLSKEAKIEGHRITFRSSEYLSERNKWDKPRAFISHDSRDKADIAQPIAVRLQTLMCPVWYDQYSLKIGDSLRESIEAGLKECHKCILLLTSNFLENAGWAKREYDSIFTRELVEKKRLILPVWHNVSAENVFGFSPILADRVAAHWAEGEKAVVRKLLQAIGP